MNFYHPLQWFYLTVIQDLGHATRPISGKCSSGWRRRTVWT